MFVCQVYLHINTPLKAKNCFCPLQDKVEETDGSGTRVAGGNWELRGSAEDVPVPLLLPAEPGVEPRPRRGSLSLQGALRAPTGLAETTRPADPAARPTGGKRSSPAAAPASAPYVRRAFPARPAMSGPILGVLPLRRFELRVK